MPYIHDPWTIHKFQHSSLAGGTIQIFHRVKDIIRKPITPTWIFQPLVSSEDPKWMSTSTQMLQILGITRLDTLQLILSIHSRGLIMITIWDCHHLRKILKIFSKLHPPWHSHVKYDKNIIWLYSMNRPIATCKFLAD